MEVVETLLEMAIDVVFEMVLEVCEWYWKCAENGAMSGTRNG